VLIPGKPFQPSLMFVGKARVEHLKGTLIGKALALVTNVGLGWKGLPLTIAIAYSDNL
jgi:hypothetical protein